MKTAVVAVAVTGVVAGELAWDADPGDEHHEEPPSQHDLERPTHFRRRLARSADNAFEHWTLERVARASPLDLRLDEDGEAYVAGLNGFLEPYADAFATGRQSSRYWTSMRQVGNIIKGKTPHEDAHVQTPHRSSGSRLYYQMLEEVDPVHRRALQLQEGGAVQLDSLEFRAFHDEEVDYESQEGNGANEEEAEDEEGEALSTADEGRFLRGLPRNSSPHRTPRNKNKQKNKNKNKKNNENRKKNQNKKKKLPTINNLVPSKNAVIQGKQTFSARIHPAEATQASISKVTFRLEDEEGNKSDWLSVPKVGPYYEITVDGFGNYPGSTWRYTMRAEDQERKKKSATVKVRVAAQHQGGGVATSPAPPAPSPEKASPLPHTHVRDSNWPHAGAVRTATGRIMFEFDDGTDASFVCSGTVVMDGRGGRKPDDGNGRAIVQTAAHCAYNDVLKQFASKAIFIPDQASTRGNKSDFDCGNDISGCWYLSFAVVAKGWAEGSFPNNVPFDYAYYTVFNDGSTHRGGYRPFLTGILDRDVTPMAIDFRADPRGEFTFSIGYSADKDPSLRHCSMANTDIYGLSWYANLWLDDCAMTGGASGGPWVVDMDDRGVGTLISVNSWGFTDRTGMAGPVLKTKGGSWAECLYDVAKTAVDPGDVGGIIVKKC